MTPSGFWDNVLEPDEKLLWTGRPKPRLHWRNWRLYGSAPMAAIGLLAAASFILATYGTASDMWLIVLPALLVLIPLRATLQQLKVYAATRYALTDRRVLFFRVKGQETRVKAHPRSAVIPAKQQNTAPPSIRFLRYKAERVHEIGFDYIEMSEALLTLLAAHQTGAQND